MKLHTDVRKFSTKNEWFRKTFWPSIDDAAQIIYNTTKNKETIELKFSPYIYSYGRKALTIGIITAAIFYAGSCNEKKQDTKNNNYNSLIKYSSNVSIQK